MNHELWSCVTYGVEFIDENGGYCFGTQNGRGSSSHVEVRHAVQAHTRRRQL
jgi:hypothetical protein